jgi:hypothetical protein
VELAERMEQHLGLVPQPLDISQQPFLLLPVIDYSSIPVVQVEMA